MSDLVVQGCYLTQGTPAPAVLTGAVATTSL
jgi:hypothetical protein